MSSLRSDVERALTEEGGAGSARWGRFRFPADLDVFAGHFPGRPLVPAVYLIETAWLLSQRAAGGKLRLAKIEEARFTRAVAPEETIRTEVELREDGGQWVCRARIESAGGPAARLRLRLEKE